MADEEEPPSAYIKLGASRGISKKTMSYLFMKYKTKGELSLMMERDVRDLEIPAAQKFRVRKLMEDLLVEAANDEQLSLKAASDQSDAEVPSEGGTDAGSLTNADSEEQSETSTTVADKDTDIMKDSILNKMLRPHEAVFGDKTKDGNFLQFIYANLLTLENMYRTDQVQSVGYLHHLHFLTLKLMQQYPVEKVFQYDHVVRSKVDSKEIAWTDRSNVGLDDDMIRECFDEEHLAKWKKMRRMSTKVMPDNNFKTDRCLSWNYSKDGADCTAEKCKYEHACLACGAKHTLLKCPTNNEKKERRRNAAKDAHAQRKP